MTDTNETLDISQKTDRLADEADGRVFPPTREAGNYGDVQNPNPDVPKPRTTDDVDKPYAE